MTKGLVVITMLINIVTIRFGGGLGAEGYKYPYVLHFSKTLLNGMYTLVKLLHFLVRQSGCCDVILLTLTFLRIPKFPVLLNLFSSVLINH